MKILFFLIIPFLSIAQATGPLYVGETDINDPANGIYYITVITNDLLKPYIDYGAAESIRDMRRKEIKDGEGNTPGPRPLEVFNFLARNGWEYVDTPAPDTYLFKKKETK